MKRRLVLGAVAVVTLALLLFAVPLAIVLRQQIVQSELDALAARLEQTATLIDEESADCGQFQFLVARLGPDDVEVTVFDRGGRARLPIDAVREERLEGIPEVLEVAGEGATGTALVDGDPAAAVPLSTFVCGERLVLQARGDGAELARRVERASLLIAAGGLVAIAGGALAAWGLGNRLARPLERLAASARRLGEGDFSERAPRAGLTEPDGIADALDVTADRLGRAVNRGTAFAADASHQLRTPLTALRLQLEAAGTGLAADDPRRSAVDGGLAELDRLTATIEDLVALTQVDPGQEPVDLAALVEDRAADWERRASELGRVVRVTTSHVPAVHVRPAAILQAMDVLMDNALRHGLGDIAVGAHSTAADGGERTLRLSVTDEGPGLPEDLDVRRDRLDRGAVPVHGGRGLLLARDLAEGEGGRLVLRSSATGTVATLLVPVGRPRGAEATTRAT